MSRRPPLPLRHTIPVSQPSQPPPKLKLQFQPKPLKPSENTNSSRNFQNSSITALPSTVPRTILKPPKKPSSQNKNVVASVAGIPKDTSSAESLYPRIEDLNTAEVEKAKKPKLTLKLSLKGAGGVRPAKH